MDELQLDTRIGCPDGLCYLPMFSCTIHLWLINELGHFPTILALTTFPHLYWLKAKGVLNIIGDGVAHFEPDKNGGLVWEIMDNMMSRFHLIGSRQLKILSFTPPEGYSYLAPFVSDRCNDIPRNLGPNPLLQTVVNINSNYWSEVEGVIWKKEPNILCVFKGFIKKNVLGQVMMWDDYWPGVNIG